MLVSELIFVGGLMLVGRSISVGGLMVDVGRWVGNAKLCQHFLSIIVK